MRIVRFIVDNEPQYGVVEGPEEVVGADGSFDTSQLEIAVLDSDPFFSPAKSTGKRVAFADARILSPIIPRSKIVGVGRNYADHAKELGNDVPTSPLLFFKPNTAVVGPGDPVRIPAVSEHVSYEAELAVVIGRVAKSLSPEQAQDAILGYTCANDVTLRDLQRSDPQWTRAKGFDTSCPLGPWIETELHPEALSIRLWVDGQLKQDGSSAGMIFDIPALISFISETITLLPGDLILTGTPAGVGQVEAGQRMSVAIAGLGVLTNPVLDA